MTWVEEEFATIALKDKRRNRRLLRVVANWSKYLGASIASNCRGWKEQMATYRLFACKRVTLAAILAPHRRATILRIQEEKVALLLQDTTELVYEGKPIAKKEKEVGPLNTTRRVGLFAHYQYAITPDRRPLGVLGIFLWAREALYHIAHSRKHKKQRFENKESHRWYKGLRSACALQRLVPNTLIVSIADREGDIYEMLVAANTWKHAPQYVIRACQDRVIMHQAKKERPRSLRMLLMLSPKRGIASLPVPAGPGRTARIAQVSLHAESITFRPPYRHDKKLPQVTVNAVMVREMEPPPNEPAIEWVLLTSLPIDSLSAIQRVIQYYACRWEIEVYFRLLKSGCHVEELQLHTRDRLAPAIALCSILAWRLHLMGRVQQSDPEMICTAICSEVEWKAIAILATGECPPTAPTVTIFLGWVAIIGGFSGRKADGKPGPLVLMRGWLRAQEGINMYRQLTEKKRCV